MSPDRPSDPQQGKTAGEEQVELEAAAAQAAKPARARKAAKAEEGAAGEQGKAGKVEQAEAGKTGQAKAPKARRARKAPAEAEAKGEAAGAAEAKPARKRGSRKAAEPQAAVQAQAAKPSERPARRREPGKPGTRRRVVRARARYVRTSARKARMVCGHLRGKSVHEARAILAFTPREVARDWSKLLESAVANAESNHELLEDDLVVREAYADEGPTIKRFRPRAMGRATPIRKRTSHLTITLTTEAGAETRNR
jgi:ribosomal protein L22